MVYLATLEEWQKQSTLLLQARPSTARITTKYNILNLTSTKYEQKQEQNKDGRDEQPRVPRATLTMKAYDPVSGVTLKFKTDRAADVGRSIAGLGTLGRHMAALPPKIEVVDTVMEDVSETANTTLTTTASKPVAQNTSTGGGKKKKKSKK